MTTRPRSNAPALVLAVSLAVTACGPGERDRSSWSSTAAAASPAAIGTRAPDRSRPRVAGGVTSSSGSPSPGVASSPSSGGTTGSRFWYEDDAFGNPLKTHDGAEASRAARLATLLNDERRQAGVAPLATDPEAERAAKAHAEDMGGRGYFAHVSPDGWTPQDRLRLLGAAGFSGAAENIAQAPSPEDVARAWMASPGHRANVLNPSFTHAGVGLDDDSGRWVVVFLRR